MSGKTWKVVYFNGRGRAESIRIALSEAGETFEDVRLTREQWIALRPDTPSGTLPVVEMDGVVLTQSAAILRYIGRMFGMYSDGPWEQYRIDMVINIIEDVVEKVLIPALFEKDPTLKAEKMAEVEKSGLQKYMDMLTRELKTGGEGFFVGSKLTIADVKIFTVLENIFSEFPDAMEKWDELKAFKERIATRPRIAEWIKKRPETWF